MAWQILLLASPGSNCSYVKNPSIPSRKSFLTEASWKWVSVTPHQKQQKLRILTQLLLASGKTSLNGPAATSQASPVSYAIVVVAQPVTPWTAAHQASPSFTISWSWLKLMSIESVMPSNHLILCHSLLLLALNLSQHHGLFHWVSSLHQVTKVLELQLQPQSFQWIFNDFL